MNDCLFCKISRGTIPASIVYENDRLMAFKDIAPKAPTHILIIPREHIATVNDLHPTQATLMGELVLTAQQLACDLNLSESGYRLVMNCNRDGGQAVYHIHLHLLGGRTMQWPPG